MTDPGPHHGPPSSTTGGATGTSRTPGTRRGVGSGLTAIVVVVAMTFAWWLMSGNGPGGGPRGNSGRADVYDIDANPQVATGAPVPTPAPLEITRVGGVALEGYVLPDPARLDVTYASGPPRCAGTLDTPEVLETDASVTVTLTLVPPAEKQTGCGSGLDGQVDRHVVIDLDSDLAGRSVLDGSYSRRVLVDRVS